MLGARVVGSTELGGASGALVLSDSVAAGEWLIFVLLCEGVGMSASPADGSFTTADIRWTHTAIAPAIRSYDFGDCWPHTNGAMPPFAGFASGIYKVSADIPASDSITLSYAPNAGDGALSTPIITAAVALDPPTDFVTGVIPGGDTQAYWYANDLGAGDVVGAAWCAGHNDGGTTPGATITAAVSSGWGDLGASWIGLAMLVWKGRAVPLTVTDGGLLADFHGSGTGPDISGALLAVDSMTGGDIVVAGTFPAGGGGGVPWGCTLAMELLAAPPTPKLFLRGRI